MSEAAIRFLKRDRVFARLIAQHGALPLVPERMPPFQSLARAIVHQQLSGRAAETIWGRFCALYAPRAFPAPGELLNTPPETLREAGLSTGKVKYLLDLARFAEERRLPTLKACEKLSDEALIETLTEIQGVGRWTVEMLLIFNLGREDVLPVGDLGVRRGFQLSHGREQPPSPRELSAYGARWAPYRSFATLYLWKAAAPTGKV